MPPHLGCRGRSSLFTHLPLLFRHLPVHFFRKPRRWMPGGWIAGAVATPHPPLHATDSDVRYYLLSHFRHLEVGCLSLPRRVRWDRKLTDSGVRIEGSVVFVVLSSAVNGH